MSIYACTLFSLSSQCFFQAGCLVFRYILDLGAYDVSCYVRDKARYFSQLLSFEGEEEANKAAQQIELLFQTNIPNIEFFGNDSARFEISSLSSVVGHKTPGFTTLLRCPGCDLPPLKASLIT